MTKQELANIAKIMYDLQEYCRYERIESEIPCLKCPAELDDLCDLFVEYQGVPWLWGITKETIERLEREGNDG